MRCMIMHKVNARLEEGKMPSPEEIAEIHGMMGQAAGAGILQGGEGLLPSRERLHVTYRGGERSVVEGPFTDHVELMGTVLSLTVRDKAEALQWMDRFAAAAGDTDVYLGPCTEPWHLGMAPKPENPPLRLLAVLRGDARSEADLPLAPETAAKVSAVIEAMSAAGVLTATLKLKATRHGARIHHERGAYTVTDGPFAESKELISGYAIFALPSKAEAIEWAKRWASTINVHEVDVRELAD